MSSKINNFPVHVFPKSVSDYINEYAVNNSFDPNYMSSAFISLVSTLICGNYRAEVCKEWKEPPIIWNAIVGNSGDKKSPSVGLILKPLDDLNAELHSQYQTTYDEAADDEERRLIRAKQIVVGDITYESLLQVLNYNPSVLLNVDELLTLFSDGNRMSKNIDSLLSIFNQRPICLNRKTDSEKKLINNPSLGLIGGFQHKLLDKFIGNGRMESGFVMRFLFTLRSEVRYKLIIKDANTEIVDAYTEFIAKLLTVQQYNTEIKDIPLNVEALEVFNDWRNVNREVRDELKCGEMNEYLSKIEGYIPRLAIVIEIVDRVNNNEEIKIITKYAVERAIELTAYYVANFEYLLKGNQIILGDAKKKRSCVADLMKSLTPKARKKIVKTLYDNGYSKVTLSKSLGIPSSTLKDQLSGKRKMKAK